MVSRHGIAALRRMTGVFTYRTKKRGGNMWNIIIGVTAITLGLWGITRNWYMIVDIIGVFVPFLLIAVGLVALLAGIRGVKTK